MTTSSKYTRPERFAERQQAKRMKVAIEKKGLCTICLHRALGETYWGRAHCRVGIDRQHETCKKDPHGPHFEADAEAVEKFKKQQAA